MEERRDGCHQYLEWNTWIMMEMCEIQEGKRNWDKGDCQRFQEGVMKEN